MYCYLVLLFSVKFLFILKGDLDSIAKINFFIIWNRKKNPTEIYQAVEQAHVWIYKYSLGFL